MKYVQQLGASVFKVKDKSIDLREREKTMMKTFNASTVLVKKKNDAVSCFRTQ